MNGIVQKVVIFAEYSFFKNYNCNQRLTKGGFYDSRTRSRSPTVDKGRRCY